MKYCQFCGKELVDGQCDCDDFRMAAMNAENANTKRRDPFIIPRFHISFKSPRAFFKSVKDTSGISEPSINTDDPFEHDIPIVPDCVQPEENEIVVKQYNIAKLRSRLKFMKAEGRLMVTNRRVLFRAAGTSITGNTLQEHQFNIDELAGVEIHKDYKFSGLSLFFGLFLSSLIVTATQLIFATVGNGVAAIVIGILLGLAGLVPNFIFYKRFWLKLFSSILSLGCFSMAFAAGNQNWFMMVMMILAGIITLIDLIIVSYVPNLVIRIKTKGASGAIVIGSQKALMRRRAGDDYCGYSEVLPWEDTIMAINELGPMIDDLQKQGDYAIEKWS